MGIFWGVAKISNIFWGMPDIHDIFLVNSRCLVQAYFANCLDPNQAQQYVGPDLGQTYFDTNGIPDFFFFLKLI